MVNFWAMTAIVNNYMANQQRTVSLQPRVNFPVFGGIFANYCRPIQPILNYNFAWPSLNLSANHQLNSGFALPQSSQPYQFGFLSSNYLLPKLPTLTVPQFTTVTSPKASTTSASTKTKPETKKKINPESAQSVVVSDADKANSDLKPGLFKGKLQGQEALVSKICRKYNVAPGLVASIIILETGWGTSNLAQHNNFGGYRAAGDLGKNEKGFGYFSTVEKGLDAMIKNIANYTRFKDVYAVDFSNIDAIGRHYCVGGNWANKVKNIYNKNVKQYLA